MYRSLVFQVRRFTRYHRALKSIKEAVQRKAGQCVDLVRRLPRPLSFGLPRGVYSDYRLLQTGAPGQEGRVVLDGQGSPPAPPGSMVLVAGKQQHAYQPWPVFWIRRREAELVGTSLSHLDRHRFISQEAAYGRSLTDGRVKADPAYYHFAGLRRPARRLAGNWTSLVSVWMSTDRTWPYGHWLKDALPRLALLPEFPPDTRILLPPVKLPYQVASLKMLGLLDRCRWTSESHLILENYYFSSPPSMIACYSPYTVDWLRATFLPRVKPRGPGLPRRFYLRRVGDVRNVANEEEILEFFRGRGWSIVDGAAVSFEDQIHLFSQAEAIVGPHGSGFSNLIWCQGKCKVLEIFCEQHLCAVAEWISHCLPQVQHRFLVFPSDHRVNALVDLKVLKKAMEDFDLL